MKPIVAGLVALMLAACASSPVVTTATPAPAPAPATVPSSTQPAGASPAPPINPPAAVAPAPDVPARDWQLLDDATDHVPGISLRRAERELLAGKQPQRTVLVAIIDGGMDTAQADLKASMWRNPREVPGNGKDDDGDGYADDVYGWNFIGGADGKDVHWDLLEVARLQIQCTGQGAAAATLGPVPAELKPRCPEIERDFNRQKLEAAQTLAQVNQMDAVLSQATRILRTALGTDSLSLERVRALNPASSDVEQAQQIYLRAASMGLTPADIAEAKKEYTARVEYQLNTSFAPRSIVGDNYRDLTQRFYGNSDVMGPDAMHGTHVAGIIAAERDNGIGIDGIASPGVRVMMIRAVPDGDERDKDIANAIRFAVDRGAQVINMSFGKGYSPQKAAVDDAVRYADAHGVLMVHAAGNDGADAGKSPSFPTPFYLNGGRAQNWIDVGASSWKGGDSLVASFSNYGKQQVDVFAPGVDILSTVPGGYQRLSGTSMASPVVAGLAALIMEYYPKLTAADVKQVILESAVRHTDQQVLLPGSADGQTVSFGSLSATGGIVNAYTALQMAERLSAGR